MGKLNIHYPGSVEVGRVWTACMVSMLRLAKHRPMSTTEAGAFAFAHVVLMDHMAGWSDGEMDEWRRGVLVALAEMREEEKADGGHSESNPADTGGNGQHHT